MPGMLPQHSDPRIGDFFMNCRLCIIPVMIAIVALAGLNDWRLVLQALTCTVLLVIAACVLIFKHNLGGRAMAWIERRLKW